MQTETSNLLTVRNLSARIGRQVVLDDVGFEMDRGECVAVVGGSGAGKSTLLRCLMGLTRPAKPFRGCVSLDGIVRDYARSQDQSKPDGIAYVPQNPDQGFDPLKRLKWQWRQAARTVTGRGDFTVSQQALLKDLGLGPFGGCFPHQWSRGMQQRLLLGMALLGEPHLLILDEPTSALDPMVAAQVLRSIMTYADDNSVALLIVTHDLALAAKHASRTAIMTDGRIVEFGETSKLLNDPKTAYGKLLVRYRKWDTISDQRDTPSVAAE